MKAIIKSTKLEVFVREESKNVHDWNKGMVRVSKQKDGSATFFVDSDNLEIIK